MQLLKVTIVVQESVAVNATGDLQAEIRRMTAEATARAMRELEALGNAQRNDAARMRRLEAAQRC